MDDEANLGQVVARLSISNISFIFPTVGQGGMGTLGAAVKFSGKCVLLATA